MTRIEEAQKQYPDYYQHLRVLPDGRAVWIQRKMFTHAITTGRADNVMSIDTHWCYETKAQALEALERWEPMAQKEPEGWFRHPESGRRRPNGDPAQEHIRL